jgi:hypothetical protein
MMRSKFLNFLSILILVLSAESGPGSEPVLSYLDIESKLLKLKPLRKVHYSWKIESGALLDDGNSRLLYEYARITHALSVCGESVTEEIIDKCVYTCARINKTKPQIPCSIGINYSPWHRKFGKDLPPTDRGPTYYTEINHFKEHLVSIKQWVTKANKKYKTDVQVTALLLDCERFQKKDDDSKWNEGMRQALDAIHLAAKSVYPQARIEWYGRGIHRMWTGDGWGQTSYFTGKEIKAPLSCSLYTVPEIERMRETFRRTCVLADKMEIEDVTPYVALASGYRRHPVKGQKWSRDWDYDLVYSWMLGAELNHPWYAQRPVRYAPYNRAKVVVLSPAPFYKRTPAWEKHFVAYVRGADNVSDLTDLGYEE